jgi:hypothetical protein
MSGRTVIDVSLIVLPESARLLASKGLQPRRVADLLYRLTGQTVPAVDQSLDFFPFLMPLSEITRASSDTATSFFFASFFRSNEDDR